MAKGGSPRVSGAGAAPPVDEGDRIIDAALAVIARAGWRGMAMGSVAAEAGLPIVAVYRRFGSKEAVMRAFFRRIDEAVLATAMPPVPGSADPGSEPDERPRDRVFDLLMRRFDALLPYRDTLDVLGREVRTDPAAALCLAAGLLRSIAWVLDAAGIATGGWRGAVAVKLTAAAYLATLGVWLRDDSPDLGPTMATLDRRLRGIERWFSRGRRGSDNGPRTASA